MQPYNRYSMNHSMMNGQSHKLNKVQSLEIILDRGDRTDGAAVYSGGEVLTGSVRLELVHSMAIKNIDLLVQGTSSVSWEQRGANGMQMISDDEVYLNEIAELIGKGDNQLVTLSAGEHQFPFACDLPSELPDSFRGSHGSVSYLVKVIVQLDENEPVQQEPLTESCAFTLCSSISMSEVSNYLKPYRLDHKQQIKSSSLSLSSRNVKLSMLLSRRAFTKDDAIVAAIDLTNCSRKPVRNMGLGLIMEVSYIAKGQRKSERVLVANIEDEHVVRNLENRKWRNVSLPVPATLPCSNLPYCNVMTLRYLLVFKADIDGDRQGVMLQVPVAVGADIPSHLRNEQGSMNIGNTANHQNTMPQVQQHQQQQHVEIAAPGRFHNSLPVAAPAAWQQQQQQQQLHQPLHVQVDQIEEQSRYRPAVNAEQKVRRPYTAQHHHKDSQLISMRFGDELDDDIVYQEQWPRTTDNPLFQQQDAEFEHPRSFGQQPGKFMSAFNASISSGVNEEVLY